MCDRCIQLRRSLELTRSLSLNLTGAMSQVFIQSDLKKIEVELANLAEQHAQERATDKGS